MDTLASPVAFDLNVEEVLDDWSISDAVRELIANALDEQSLSGTQDIQIHHDGHGTWTIRDYGRGVRIEHLTQNENQEKIDANGIIGKFGVGLKDALAVLSRRDVAVRIISRHCSITTKHTGKHGFEDIVTLHALIEPSPDNTMRGTLVTLGNILSGEVERAQTLFRRFNPEEVVESTKYGDILGSGHGQWGRIYINGVLVAQEDNFLFSYDITSLTKKMKSMLNRERTNVGRTAYADRVKSILLEAREHRTLEALAKDIQDHETGLQHQETQWSDVAVRAIRLLNASQSVMFATAEEQRSNADILDEADRQGINIVTVPNSIANKLRNAVDENGTMIRDVMQYNRELQESFQFRFVEPANLTSTEQDVWRYTSAILRMASAEHLLDSVRISETMRPGTVDVNGLWDPQTRMMVVKRSQLTSVDRYAGTLLHEVVHAVSGTADVTREFELELTDMLGRIAASSL